MIVMEYIAYGLVVIAVIVLVFQFVKATTDREEYRKERDAALSELAKYRKRFDDWAFIPAYGRRTGRTTRLVDLAVNDFFKNGMVELVDHSFEGHNNRHICDRLMFRLKAEHNITYKQCEVIYASSGRIIVRNRKDLF